MAKFSIWRQDIRDKKAFKAPTGDLHPFELKKPTVHVLELEDIHFHHDSAVLLPDARVGVDPATPPDPDKPTTASLAAVATCLKFAKDHPKKKLLIVGHTDTSGDAAYNLPLSRQRAKAVHSLVAGKRDDWIDVCMEKSKVEDYQQILRWVAAAWGWPCDPGAVDNNNGPKTKAAVKAFQDTYSNHWKDDSKKKDKIDVDGVVGRDTWGAIFDVYGDALEQILEIDTEADLDKFRGAVHWLDDATPRVGCGEKWPIDEPEKENYKSETNRRVELLFFGADHEPETPLRCHPSETKCDGAKCQIYWKYHRIYIPVDPFALSHDAYRMTLSLGKIEDLFADAPNTAKGRMARLQVLGLFYFPLAHAHALNAFNGMAATAVNPGTGHPGNQAFLGAWSYFKSDIVDGKSAAAPATDAEADADIQTRLEKFVVDQGTLPDPVAEGEAADAAKNFRKIRLLGGFTFVNGDGGSLDTNRGAGYALAMTDSQFAAENLYYRDNPILGKVPIVAKVEFRAKGTDEWVLKKDVTVYFQLVPTDALPAYDPTQPANAQINRPALRDSNVGGPADPSFAQTDGTIVPAEPLVPALASGAGPRLRYTNEEARHADATDPQGTNCHTECGGKRGTGSAGDGSDVAGVIFEVASRPGFNAKHASRALPHKDYAVAQKVSPDGEKHKHSVKALTNDDGEAGVIFMPSRMGGDKYRLRAYIGPPTLPSDGTETTAEKQETGTFVVWRSLRLRRYYQVVPGDPDPALLAEVNNAATYNITSNARYRRRAGVQNNPGLNTGNWNAVEGSPAPQFAGPVIMWARAWCEFEIERNALSGGNPLALTTAQYLAARTQALADGIAGQASVGASYNLRNLLYMEAGAPALTPATGIACVPIRTPEAYNAMAGTTAPQRITIATDATGATTFGADATHQTQVDNLHLNHLLPGFTRSLTENGHLPGFTVIQSAMGCTWQIIGQNGDFSGIALNYRAGHLWYGTAVYARFNYGYDSNMCHEMGHCHYREHAPGRDAGRTPGGGNNPAKHDALATGICVMGYKTCEGDLCGMCTIGLRGWDIAPMTS